MELDIIKSQTTWNDAVGGINSNFAKIKAAFATVGTGGGGGLDEDELRLFLEQNGYTTENWVKLQKYLTAESADLFFARKEWVEQQIAGIDLSPYAKSTDVANTYATISALNTLEGKHNTLRSEFDALSNLLSSDTSDYINTWNEVVAFLDGYKDESDLATILSGMNADISSRLLISTFDSWKADTYTPLANLVANHTTKLDSIDASITNINTRLEGVDKTIEDHIAEFIAFRANFEISDDLILVRKNFASTEEVSAKGINQGTGGGGGSSYSRLDTWEGYDSNKAGYVLSAGLGYGLKVAIDELEGYNLDSRVRSIENSYVSKDAGGVVNGGLVVSSLAIAGGSSSQFLKADGSLDGTSYLPTIGGVITGDPALLTFRVPRIGADAWLQFTDTETSDIYAIGLRRPADMFGLQYKINDDYYDILHSGNIGEYAPAITANQWATSAAFIGEVGTAYIAYRGGSDWSVTDNEWSNEYTLYHSGNFNPADYLPLSGGTINGTIKIHNVAGAYNSVIEFSNTSSYLGALGVSSYNRPVFYNGAAYEDILTTSGGTIKGSSIHPLTIDTYGEQIGIYFSVNGSIKTEVGWDESNGAFLYNYVTGDQISLTPEGEAKVYINRKFENILHTGNVGDYAIKRSLSISLEDDLNVAGYGGIEKGWPYNGAALILGYDKDYKFYLQADFSVSSHFIKTRYYGAGSWRGDWKTIAFTDSDITGNAAGLKHSNGTVGATVDEQGKILSSGYGIATTNGNWQLSTAGYRGDFGATNSDGVELCSSNGVLLSVGGKGLILDSSGNVSIGATISSYKLHVDGDVALTGDLKFFGGCSIQSYNSTALSINPQGNDILLNQNGYNNVGIGTSSPSYKLDVIGDIRATESITIGGATLSWENGALKVNTSFYSEKEISAKGLSTGGGSGASYNRLDAWGDYDSSKAGYVLSAGLGYDLNTRLSSLSGVVDTHTSRLSSLENAGYITSSALSGYLPLSGGTINGKLTLKPQGYHAIDIVSPDNALAQITISINDTLRGIVQYNSNFGFGFHHEGRGGIYVAADGTPTYVDSSLAKLPLIHEGNCDMYSLSVWGGTLKGKLTLSNADIEIINGHVVFYDNKLLGIDAESNLRYYNNGWNTLLHSGNVGDYALSTSGGTIGGNLAVDGYIINKGHFFGVNDNDNAEWYVTDKNWHHSYTLIHSGNIGSHALTLDGGYLNNNRGIAWYNNVCSWDEVGDGLIGVSNLTDSLGYHAGLSFKAYYGLQIRAYGGDTDDLEIRGYNAANWGIWRKIIHSGNIGSQSVAYAASAGYASNAGTVGGYGIPTNDNKPWGALAYITPLGWTEMGRHIEFHYDNTTGSDYSTVLGCTGNYGNFVYLPSASGTLALTTDNVASATKLATPRTIWGQSFDGTGNVGGDLSDVTFLKIRDYDYGIYKGNYFGGLAASDIVFTAPNLYFYTSKFSMLINSSGNVTIGATDLTSSSYRLYVDGTGYFSDALTANGGLTVNGILTVGGASIHPTANNPYFQLYQNNNYWYWQADNSYTYIGGTMSKALRIDQDGNTLIRGSLGVTGDATMNNATINAVAIAKRLVVGTDGMLCNAPATFNDFIYGSSITPRTDNYYVLGNNNYKWYAVTAYNVNVHDAITIEAGKELRFKDDNGVVHTLKYDSTKQAFVFDGNVNATGEMSAKKLNA